MSKLVTCLSDLPGISRRSASGGLVEFLLSLTSLIQPILGSIYIINNNELLINTLLNIYRRLNYTGLWHFLLIFMMLIENIELSRALRMAEESASGPTWQNFYDVFSTYGCSLDYNDRRAVQEFRHLQPPSSSGEKKIKASMTRKAETKKLYSRGARSFCTQWLSLLRAVWLHIQSNISGI